MPQEFESLFNTARLLICALHLKIISHQDQSKRQRPYRRNQVGRSSRVRVYGRRGKPREQGKPILLGKFLNPISLCRTREFNCQIGVTGREKIRTIRPAQFERQSRFDLPGIIYHNQQPPQTNCGTNQVGSFLQSVPIGNHLRRYPQFGRPGS